MSEPETKRRRDFKRGADRKYQTGFMLRRSDYSPANPRAPRWSGEIRIDPACLNQLIENQGVMRIAAWERFAAGNGKCSYMEMRLNFWKPGDTTQNLDPRDTDDDDEFGDDFWEIE